MRLNLHLLRIFQTVAELRSFSRAADRLLISQSAVSKGVRELEAQLGLPLLQRARGVRGVLLTDHGQAVYDHARGIFAMERAALEDVRDRVELRRGRLRLGASTTVAGYWLADPISRLLSEHSQIDFALIVGNTGRIANAVRDGEVDLALVEGQVAVDGLVSTFWRDDTLCLVAPASMSPGPRGRPSAGMLAQATWLCREPGSGTRQAADALLADLGIRPQRRIELGSNEAIAQGVAAGIGVAVLPRVMVEDLVAVGRVGLLWLPAKAPVKRPLYRLELANRPRTPALQAFLAQLESAAV